jgi:hypothetical protein
MSIMQAVDRLERGLRELGDVTRSLLSEAQRSWFEEFVDAGECGLALESLADWLSEDEVPIRSAVRDEMQRLGQEMGIVERVSGSLRFCPDAG